MLLIQYQLFWLKSGQKEHILSVSGSVSWFEQFTLLALVCWDRFKLGLRELSLVVVVGHSIPKY